MQEDRRGERENNNVSKNKLSEFNLLNFKYLENRYINICQNRSVCFPEKKKNQANSSKKKSIVPKSILLV